MRRFVKNCSTFWYANFVSNEMITGEGGYKTGEKRTVYTKPKEGYENISPAKGDSYIQQFGTYDDYSKVILTYDPNYPMDENSVLWVDTNPRIDANGNATVPHDYVVKHIATSLNVKAFAIQKVKKS